MCFKPESDARPACLPFHNWMRLQLLKLANIKLAGIVNMAPNSFARLFKQRTGQTPQAYIRKIRIDNACRLLHHSELSISTIAEECGFSDRYYFTKVFSDATSVGPAQYRKRFLLSREI